MMSSATSLSSDTKFYLKFSVRHRKAIKRLPMWMTDKYLHKDDCPLFHYGIPVSVRQLGAYGIKQGIYNTNEDAIMHRVVMHPRHFGVIALYNNFDKHRLQPSPDKEAAIIQTIIAELGLSPNLQPRWYWDLEVPMTEKLGTKRRIPCAVAKHVEQTLGPEYVDEEAECESSDEELKTKLSSVESESDMEDYSESDTEDYSDEESGVEDDDAGSQT
ncbi:hypothetical protein PUNSTDRAFT_144521 [Punctularia strigosozonata HHB-11173 SS5]|uniref:uncharacterized protein n=1 Tax=Punctularia strigosozonata (strain HHB-11173) TaxID=741275 RepID=UPI0004417ED7|nr:uncharacterized protein PUNSTDRAFT_144521 [Punctularia strigosozonata HHB-11173 SS5]EIN08086.1 hypothetical protein PUNSTDRAFT_144521 [Punctularia strigosozonata HHB-11173 SS5]